MNLLLQLISFIMSYCQSTTHAWYLKYDYYTLNESHFVKFIEDVFKGLNLVITYQPISAILTSSPLNFTSSLVTFSTNSLDKHLQEFLMKLLCHFIDFIKNELYCVEENLEFLEKGYNFINLEIFYCQSFWKAALNKPIPEFLRDRLFCSLFRIESFLFEIHDINELKDSRVFAGLLELLSSILKEFLIEMRDLKEHYGQYFNYLLRLFNILKAFSLIEKTEELENFLTVTFSKKDVDILIETVLEKSRNKNSFKQIDNSYNLLIEDSMTELKTRTSHNNDTDPDFIVARLSSKAHSNSLENNNIPQNDNEFEALTRLSKRTSRTIGGLSNNIINKKYESPKLVKTLTFKDNEENENNEEYSFINNLANSYLTSQIMSSQGLMGPSFQRFANPPPENQAELSIISSKMLLKSPNLPFNSYLGRSLQETSIDDALASKIVAGIKSQRAKKSDLLGTSQEIQDNLLTSEKKGKKATIKLSLNRGSKNKSTLLKKPSDVQEKLTQNLFNILISREPNQIRDNILIAKNKKSGVKLLPNNSEDIDGFFEKRRKDRLIHSNRESSIKDINEEFMTKSGRKLEEIIKDSKPGNEKLSNQGIEEKKMNFKDNKSAKTIEIVNIKEKDFIKINKMTEITEKLMATLFHEAVSNEVCDEDIMEVSEEEENDENNENSKLFHEYNKFREIIECFTGKIEEKNEEYWVIPGVKIILQEKRKNMMDYFRPLYSLSARRRGMYNEITEGLVKNGGDLVGEFKEYALYYKRNKKLTTNSGFLGLYFGEIYN